MSVSLGRVALAVVALAVGTGAVGAARHTVCARGNEPHVPQSNGFCIAARFGSRPYGACGTPWAFVIHQYASETMPGCLDGSSVASSHHATEIQISRLYKTTLYSLHALPHPFAELYSYTTLYYYTALYIIQRIQYTALYTPPQALAARADQAPAACEYRA